MTAPLDRLRTQLSLVPARVIACSGGIDSMTLATVAHKLAPATTVVAHAVTAAVPTEATGRVMRLSLIHL